ncbi:bifunctional DNA primase/polymerase [Streptomyces sp. NBRC 109706]|uniref:bifunctional DNA primase/polymerase n=1 Tax=Streptomyces sp. NBRC 109706 TaxID=1550035 RepID=UPI00099C91B0|nr:bifunctional DNA primase/polymerase [Streptomyces sp. NBRC 109706]
MMTRRGLGWLSEAADLPERCREVWADDPRRPYALPTGRLFDVVVLEQRIGVETFDQLERHQMPVGPVMADWATRQIGFFLFPGSRAPFDRTLASESSEPPTYRYLGTNSLAVVPGPMPLSGDRYTWLRAPAKRLDNTPTHAVTLAAMLVAAHELVIRADRYGEALSRRTADDSGKGTDRDQ